MDDTAKKETLEEAKKDEKKIELTDEEAEKIAGGASFGFYDREKKKAQVIRRKAYNRNSLIQRNAGVSPASGCRQSRHPFIYGQ